MTLDQDKEMWAIALWVEEQHGVDGPQFIAEQIGRLALQDDREGMDMWFAIAERYERLLSRGSPVKGLGNTTPYSPH